MVEVEWRPQNLLKRGSTDGNSREDPMPRMLEAVEPARFPVGEQR
jgi:hypothetical protein